MRIGASSPGFLGFGLSAKAGIDDAVRDLVLEAYRELGAAAGGEVVVAVLEDQVGMAEVVVGNQIAVLGQAGLEMSDQWQHLPEKTLQLPTQKSMPHRRNEVHSIRS